MNPTEPVNCDPSTSMPDDLHSQLEFWASRNVSNAACNADDIVRIDQDMRLRLRAILALGAVCLVACSLTLIPEKNLPQPVADVATSETGESAAQILANIQKYVEQTQLAINKIEATLAEKEIARRSDQLAIATVEYEVQALRNRIIDDQIRIAPR